MTSITMTSGTTTAGLTVIEQILDAARWAPSGDNTQPWRFEVLGPRQLVVHGHDTREHCVYDLAGEASQLSLGALLESIDIAASMHGLSADVTRRQDAAPARPTFDISLRERPGAPDPLAAYIRSRTVQRRALSTRPLTHTDKLALEAAAGPGYRVLWFEGSAQRWQVARLMFRNAHLRLTMPEAYEVHRSVIEWGARHSVDRVPDQALGADAVSLIMMRTAMKSWSRVQFANRFLAGTWIPRLQMDLLPALACAAHFVIVAKCAPEGTDDFVAAGRAVQRAWLTATALGLWQQPEMTPLIFARYARQGTRFTRIAKLQARASGLETRLRSLLGSDAESAVWMGRIGAGSAPTARSVRRPLAELMVNAGGDQKR